MSDPPSPPPGFLGTRSHVIASAQDGAHTVTLAVYRFPPGDGDPPGHVDVPYIELHETHDGARPGRVMALSALVHLAQNVGDDEVWEIGGRETPGGGSVEAQLTAARATIARLNRRAQQAEAIADRCVAGRPTAGRSLGRALANYAAVRIADVAREAIATLDASGDPAAAALRARLDVLTGGGARATVAGMSSPTLDAFAAAFYQAMIHNHDPEKQPRWEALTPEQQAERREQAKGALLYIGAPYEAGPGSPPPTEPGP